MGSESWRWSAVLPTKPSESSWDTPTLCLESSSIQRGMDRMAVASHHPLFTNLGNHTHQVNRPWYGLMLYHRRIYFLTGKRKKKKHQTPKILSYGTTLSSSSLSSFSFCFPAPVFSWTIFYITQYACNRNWFVSLANILYTPHFCLSHWECH